MNHKLPLHSIVMISIQTLYSKGELSHDEVSIRNVKAIYLHLIRNLDSCRQADVAATWGCIRATVGPTSELKFAPLVVPFSTTIRSQLRMSYFSVRV